MSALVRVIVVLALAAGFAPRATAAVEIGMTVEGPRGPFASADSATPSTLKVSSVQLDLGAATSGPLVAPRPVVVTRPIDVLSWQFLGAASSGDLLRVVITVTRTQSDSEERHRRVVTLTNARVATVHAGMDAVRDDGRPGLGVETLVFTYERIEVEDDGLKVFTSGA
jgi:type VI protein secretion system component Hcp